MSGGTGTTQVGGKMGGPVPPALHWALVLALSLATCCVFGWVWVFVQAFFIGKLRPARSVVVLYVTAFALAAFDSLLYWTVMIDESDLGLLVLWASSLVTAAIFIFANFTVRSRLLDYYNTVEPIDLRLSGLMTFFFGILYFQYHFTRIARWKHTVVLRPQG